MSTRVSRSARIVVLSFVSVLAIGFVARAADAPRQPSDPAGAQTAPHSVPVGAGATEAPVEAPVEDLDAAMPECAPFVSTPVYDHPANIANAPVENCDIRETVLSGPKVEGPKKEPVAPPAKP